ncbi:MAG: hypothetical protein ACRDHN_20860, partial [Thermomicrobiales bacterium]
MLKCFSPAERKNTLNQLVAFAQTNEAIVGTLLVGSGAHAFSDDFSDIDIVFVANPQDFVVALDSIAASLRTELQPVFLTSYQHRRDVVVLCGLLANLLEVDVGVWSSETLFASSPKWKLLQSRNGEEERR